MAGLVDAHKTIGQFKHVVSQTDNDKLCILGAFCNVVGDNRDVTEIQGSVNFIHDIQRCWLKVVQGEYQC